MDDARDPQVRGNRLGAAPGHPRRRPRNELALAGLEAAFLPLAVAAEREGLFDYQVAVAELDGERQGLPPIARRSWPGCMWTRP